MKSIQADDYISLLINKFREDLEKHLGSDVITIRSPINFGLDDIVRLEVENIHKDEKDRPEKLSVVLETTGGFVETVERIYNVFRNHYKTVDFIVPNYAFSAGTILVMSADNIYMDYYSVLGPIDPQYQNNDGRFVPGLGYLAKYNELIKHINSSSGGPSAYRAQLAYLLKKFDPALLFDLEQARNHSISLLEEWLPKHKFSSWKKTKTRGRPVTPAMRRRRAKTIATLLSNPERWHSHGRGIGFRELTSEEIKLEIIDFGKDADLNEKIGNYYDLLLDYSRKTGYGDPEDTVIHSGNGLKRI